jgi:hypothetical protein
MLVLAAPQYAESHRAHEDVATLLAQIPKKSAVTVVVPDGPGDRRRAFSTATAPSRSVAVLGGRAGLSLGISEFAPVQIRPDARWNELDRRLLAQGTLSLRPSYDLARFGWVLARTPDQASLSILARAFGDDAAPVALAGEWTLFRSTHDVVSIDAPDADVPRDADTLRDRLKRLASARAEPPSR